MRFLITAVSLLSVFLAGEGQRIPRGTSSASLETNPSHLHPMPSAHSAPSEPSSPPWPPIALPSLQASAVQLPYARSTPFLPLPFLHTLPCFLQYSGGGSCTWSLLWRM